MQEGFHPQRPGSQKHTGGGGLYLQGIAVGTHLAIHGELIGEYK